MNHAELIALISKGRTSVNFRYNDPLGVVGGTGRSPLYKSFYIKKNSEEARPRIQVSMDRHSFPVSLISIIAIQPKTIVFHFICTTRPFL